MRYRLAIFDMDGTILDTLEDMFLCVNTILDRFGMPLRTKNEVRQFVGNGIGRLIHLAVPEGTDEQTEAEVLTAYLPYYQEHCGDHTKPYEGILSLLERLKAKGYLLAVVSNKADEAVQVLCQDYFPGIFDAAVGERKGIERKPSPDSVWEVLHLLNCTKEESVYVGDSEVDILTGMNGEMEVISVTWGFREESLLRKMGGTCFAHDAKELADYLLG